MIKEGVILSGRYEILERVGAGGMADVYKGRDHKLNRYVAVKVLKREFREDELFVRKFGSEAQAAAGLMHPNIVNVYDVGEDRGLYYMVMELVEGITLKDYIQKKGKLTPKEVISITIQVCAGIEAAHNNQIIHRDIKPQNIIISKEGKVKVTDFGIAKATSSNTISTNAMGSVHYTSPEQARGGFSDAKSDIYSLGITMYEMITGRLPFDGETTVAIAIKHLQEDIAAPSEYVPDIPYSLERIILKCTQKSPDRRYADMAQLIRDLKRSLVDPEGDFVTIAPFASVADTVMIKPSDLSRIQKEADYEDDEDEEYDEDYDYDDEDDDYDDADENNDRQREYRRNRRGRKKKNDEVNPKMAKIMRILTIVVSAIIIFMLIFVIGKATGILKFGPGIESVSKNTVKVPSLVGKTKEEAEKLCKKAGLRLKVDAEKKSSKYDKGKIIKQKTDKNTPVEKGTIIHVEISSGLEGKEIVVPDVSKMTEEEALAALLAKGFKEENITVVTKADDEVEKGKVITTTPEAGEKATEDTEIEIVVSEGSGKATVPRLRGKSKTEAMNALENAGLSGNPIEEFSDRPEGEVLWQSQGEGSEVNKGTTIDFGVSKGPKPKEQVTVPSGLSGQLISSVKATLQNMDLYVDVRYEESTQYADGYVIGVNQEGQSVEKGSTIVVRVSTGPGPSMPTPDPEPGDGEGEDAPVQ